MRDEKEKQSRAGEDILALIHTLTAERLLHRLQNAEELSPAEINAIRQFLKDNEITATPEDGTPHKRLTDAFSGLDAEAVGLFAKTAGA